MGHRGKVKMLVTLVAALTALSGCAVRTYTALETGRLASSVDAAKSLIVGEGRYAYQFTLIDPHTGKPWANHPYALTTGLHNHYHLPFVADPKNVYQGESDADGKTALFRLPVKIADKDWDLRERFGSGPNGETFRLKNASTGKPLADFPYLLMICSTPPKYHIGYSYPNGDTAYSASDQPERITLSEGGSYDENDLPKSCDEPDDAQPASNDVKPMVPFASGEAAQEAGAAHLSDSFSGGEVAPEAQLYAKAKAADAERLAPTTVTESSKELQRNLMGLMKRGDDALHVKEYATSRNLFEQADAIMAEHDSEFMGFAGFFGRAELHIHLATAIGDGKLGDPCLATLRSAEWAAKAKLETYNDGESERRDEADALMSRIQTEAKRLGCSQDIGLGIVPNATATPEQVSPEERVIDLSQKGTESYLAKDYPNASRFFHAAQDIIDENPSAFTSFFSMMGRTNHALYMARVDGEGKLGDPCVMVARSRSLLAQAKLLAVGQYAELWLSYVVAEKAKIDEVVTKFHCAVAAPKGSALATADATLAGHYYLSGVTEVGSELLLKPDGSFEWMLAYGAVDQAAHGTWKQEGDEVVLTADKGDPLAPIFTLGPLQPWDDDAEQRLQDMIFDQNQAQIEKRCPFLLGDDVTSALTAPAISDAEREARRRRAKAAIHAASDDVETKRLLAARAAQIAMAATSDRAQKMGAATKAMISWKEARGLMLDLYNTAGLKEPVRLEPALPDACVPSQRAVFDEKDPTKWQRGFAARVYDPAAGMSFSDIKVAFTYSDGVVEERLTNYSGFAILPLRAGVQVNRLTVTFHSEGEPVAETFPITPAASGIQHVGINSRAIIASPFSTLRLKIDGQDLVSAQMHNGHYVRQ